MYGNQSQGKHKKYILKKILITPVEQLSKTYFFFPSKDNNKKHLIINQVVKKLPSKRKKTIYRIKLKTEFLIYDQEKPFANEKWRNHPFGLPINQFAVS